MVAYIREHDIQTSRVTLGNTGLGHGVGLGDEHGGLYRNQKQNKKKYQF